jgi:hypothetical protein
MGGSRAKPKLVAVASRDTAAAAFRFANRAVWLQRIHTLYAGLRRQDQKMERWPDSSAGVGQWQVTVAAYDAMGRLSPASGSVIVMTSVDAPAVYLPLIRK